MIEIIITNGQKKASGPAQARLTRVLESHGVTTARVAMAFTDQNGPKGGVAKRCAIGLRLPRRPLVQVQRTATTGRLALDGALDVLGRELARLIARRRDATRHRKYYAAKRLLDERRQTSNPTD
jgi:hypothetical protein